MFTRILISLGAVHAACFCAKGCLSYVRSVLLYKELFPAIFLNLTTNFLYKKCHFKCRMKTCSNMSFSIYTEHILLYHVIGYLSGGGRLMYFSCVVIKNKCDTLHWTSTSHNPKTISEIIVDTQGNKTVEMLEHLPNSH